MATIDNPNDDYSYRTSGLDDNFTRQSEIGGGAQQEPQGGGGELNYDNLQTGGSLGNVLQVGSLRLNGIDGRLEILNDNGEIIGVVGSLDDL